MDFWSHIYCSLSQSPSRTWSSWWYDARLAGPAHAVDIIVFTYWCCFTDGHTSPYFAFFMFVMLSAAIRWGWRATALTAVLLALMFTITGLLDLTPGEELEPDRFVIRAGHLAILSMILIWFGASRQWPRSRSRRIETEQPARA